MEGEFWRTHLDDTRRYFLGKRLDLHHAEDLAQEVCFRAWKSWCEGRVRRLERGWFCAIRWRVLADHRRASYARERGPGSPWQRYRQLRSQVLVTGCSVDLDGFAARSRAESWLVDGLQVPKVRLLGLVDDLLPGLRESWRTVLEDRLRGLSMQAIADGRGLSLDSVRMRLHRGRRVLRQRILERLEEEEDDVPLH